MESCEVKINLTHHPRLSLHYYQSRNVKLIDIRELIVKIEILCEFYAYQLLSKISKKAYVYFEFIEFLLRHNG